MSVMLTSTAWAGPMDEALKQFREQMEAARQKEAQLNRPVGQHDSYFKIHKPAPVKQGSASDFKQHQLPVGTEVRVSSTNLERILSQPRLTAAPDIDCISIARAPNENAGRFIIDGYASSQESPATNPKPGTGPAKGEFTALWAQVHHVVIKDNDPLGRDATHACKGWTRIDAGYQYYQGTGAYPNSVLRIWNDTGLTPAARENNPRITITQNGHMVESPKPGARSTGCLAHKGDQYIVLERLPASKMLKIISPVRTSGCPPMSAGYIPERLVH
ncbi:MAG: hypothetical protein KDE31_01390 [Caldilineaceae bacterium]|nr:hypothetical protein [Caldilineaceae bacterium]